jgi:hypothetical protein
VACSCRVHRPAVEVCSGAASPYHHCPNPLESPQGLIICPSRELASQTHEIIVNYTTVLAQGGFPELRTMLCIGGIDMRQQTDILKRGVHMVVATPGRLKDFLHKKRMNLDICRCVGGLVVLGQVFGGRKVVLDVMLSNRSGLQKVVVVVLRGGAGASLGMIKPQQLMPPGIRNAFIHSAVRRVLMLMLKLMSCPALSCPAWALPPGTCALMRRTGWWISALRRR